MIGKCCCIVIGIITGCVIIFGVSILAYILHIAKSLPKGMVYYQVTDASLTKFNLTTNSTLLDYDLKLDLTLENPSPFDYNFTRLDAVPVFKGQNLNDMTNVSKPFDLAHETNVTLQALFSGNHLVALGAQEASDFGKDGVFDIGLKMNSEFLVEKKKKKVSFKHEVTCDLKVPLNSNGTNVGGNFQITKCKVGKVDVN
ncbi:hypothetical protein ACLB2K_064274 [Fragaria x ananassa]